MVTIEGRIWYGDGLIYGLRFIRGYDSVNDIVCVSSMILLFNETDE